MSDLGLIVYVMMAEALLHYIPWKPFLRGRDLPRPIAYALGVCGLMLPFTAWLYEQGETEIIVRLWMVIISGGIAVLALYGADSIRDLWWRERESSEREAEARKQDV